MARRPGTSSSSLLGAAPPTQQQLFAAAAEAGEVMAQEDFGGASDIAIFGGDSSEIGSENGEQWRRW